MISLFRDSNPESIRRDWEIMADLYDLIERMQVTLASSNRPAKEQLRELHGELTDHIRRINKRLRECDGLMAKGLRTEAIQMAEQEPPLLDVVAILDFPELPEWNDFVAELGLTVAPDLQIEIAADLNRAYSDDGPLKSHLRRFRLSSLSRAPLRTRISLLRKIAEIDSGNPIWETDLKGYEEVRQRQIKEQFQIANRNHDFEELREIAKELHGKWMSPPSKQFIQRVDQEVKSLQLKVAQTRLAQLADDLLDAYDDKDLNWAAEVQNEWEKVLKICGASDDVREFQKQVRPVLSWLSEQQKRLEDESKFREAAERLQRSINSEHDLAELKRRFAAATRFVGFNLPEGVQEAYESAVLNHQRKRKMRLIIIASSVAALIVITGLVLLILKPTA